MGISMKNLIFLFLLWSFSVNAQIEALLEQSLYITPTVDTFKIFSGHRNGDGSQVSYQWRQLSGKRILLQDDSERVLTISHPNGIPVGTYVFKVSVTQSNVTSSKEIKVISQAGTRIDRQKPSKVIGKLMKWNPVSIYFDGPNVSENDSSTFTDHRVNVLFTHYNAQNVADMNVLIPGHFACSFESAHEDGCTEGNQWRVKFSPSKSGLWTYRPFFHTGTNVAMSLEINPSGAILETSMITGHVGSLYISNPNNESEGFYKTGRINKAENSNYLIAAEADSSKDYWLKFSAGSPETFLAYEGFDNTCKLKEGQNSNGNISSSNRDLHHYDSPVHSHKDLDYETPGPFWHGDRGNSDSNGLGIIGTLDYLAKKGANGLYIMMMNVEGDGENLWPFVGGCPNEPMMHTLKYDVSKLEQWEKVFTHADKKGILLQMFFNETENTNFLSHGQLFPNTSNNQKHIERALYYRELISRFSHHLAITWNLGEEYNENTSWLPPIIERVKALDPYDSLITLHTYPTFSSVNHYDRYYGSLLNNSDFGGASFQITENSSNDVNRDAVTNYFFKWWRTSRNYDQYWVNMMDERGPYNTQAQPDSIDFEHNDLRKHAIWDSLLNRGAGLSWYFGFIFNADDHDIEANNQASREQLFIQSSKANHSFNNWPKIITLI